MTPYKDVSTIRRYAASRNVCLLHELSPDASSRLLQRSRDCLREKTGNQEVAQEVVEALASETPCVQIVTWNVASLRARIVDTMNASEAEKLLTKKNFSRPLMPGSPLADLISHSPDVICFQETKLGRKGNESLFGRTANSAGYTAYWCTGKKPGYSGVSTWVRQKPRLRGAGAKAGFPAWVFDNLDDRAKARLDAYRHRAANTKNSCPLLDEGRILTISLHRQKLVIVNTYVPNTQRAGNKTDKLVREYEAILLREGVSPPHSMKFNPGKGKEGNERVIDWRVDWDNAIQVYLTGLQSSGPAAMDEIQSSVKDETWDVIWCGDMNVARKLNDLFHGQHSVDKLYTEAEKPSGTQPRQVLERLQDYVKRGIKMETKGGFSGFRTEEREGMEYILSQTRLVDAYRLRYPEKFSDLNLQDIAEMVQGELYEGMTKEDLLRFKQDPSCSGFTFWDQTQGRAWRTKANNGMRIDYFFISPRLTHRVVSAKVLRDIGVTPDSHASDHAPLLLRLGIDGSVPSL